MCFVVYSVKKVNSSNNVKNHYLTWLINNLYMSMFICIYIFLCVRGCVCINIWIYIYQRVFPWFIHSHVFFLVYPFLSFSFWLEEPLWKYGVSVRFLHCWCNSYLSAVIFQFHFLYFNSLPVCLLLVCFIFFFCLS